MAFLRRTRIKDGGFRPIVFYFLVTLFGFTFWKLGTSYFEELYGNNHGDTDLGGHVQWWDSNLMLPNQTELSITLDKQNHLPPRNLDLFPTLSEDHVKIVLYVYNRPHYLQVVVDSLAKVEGIEETLLIVSHDGFFPEMDAIVKRIRFCQVKQIYAPFSPHLFPNSFPGVSPGDCEGRDEGVASKKTCIGDSDQYMNYRSPNTVSLKHHWWWLMNTVWDGLEETKGYSGHVLFIEEDHFIYPNAYRSIQLLTKLKSSKCSYCYAANLSPSDVLSKGEGVDSLIAEKIGNIGYTFNRTVWNLIHSKTRDFCRFDEYNWDITMWSTVYPSFKTPVYTLRGSRRSAAHFGKCGLHQGQGKSNACVDNGVANFEVEEIDKVVNIKSDFGVKMLSNQGGYQDDDFFSVNGDYTPLGGSTPNNQVVINPIPTTPRLNKTLINNVHLPSSENPSPFLSPRKKFSEFLSEPSTEEQSVREEAGNGELNGMSGKEQVKLNGDSHGMKKSSRTTTRCCLPMLSKRKTLDSTNPQRVEHSQDGGPDLDGKVLFETSPKGMGPGQEPCPPPR